MEPEVALRYVREGRDKVLDMMISFAHMEADCFMTDFIQRPFDLVKLKKPSPNGRRRCTARAGTRFTWKTTTIRAS